MTLITTRTRTREAASPPVIPDVVGVFVGRLAAEHVQHSSLNPPR